jgi:hypothetical protein
VVTADGRVVVVVDDVVVVVDVVDVVALPTSVVVGRTVVTLGAPSTAEPLVNPRKIATNAKESMARRMTDTLATKCAHEMAPVKRYWSHGF